MSGKLKSAIVIPLLLVTSTLVLSSCGGPDGTPEDGARWYAMHNCSACHGSTANNGKAAKIAGINMRFGSFVHYLRNPDSPSMPPFPEERVSKADAADIYVWLKSLPE